MDRERSVGPPRGLGGRESLPEGQNGSGDPPGKPALVRRPCRLAGTCRETLQRASRGQEALPEGWEGPEGPPRGQAEVGRPARWSGRG